MADEDLLPIDQQDDWKKALAVLAPRPQMDNRMMQAAPVAQGPPALNVNPTGTPTTPPDTALRIPGNDGLKGNDSALKTPSLSGALTAPDVSTSQPAYQAPAMSNMLRTMGAQPKPQAPQDLEPHGWRKALGLSLLALTGKEAGANADEFLHGGERRAAAAAKQASDQQLQQANIRHLDAETQNIGVDKPGKTMDEQAFASLVKQGKTPLEAYTAIKQAGQDVKPDRVKTPEEQALDFLQTTVNPTTNKNYTLGEAYEKIKSEGKPPAENEEERNIQSYLTTNKLADNAANRAKALTYFTQAKQDPGIAAANARQNKTEDFSEAEAGRNHLTKIEDDYTKFANQVDAALGSVKLAKEGNLEASAIQQVQFLMANTNAEAIRRLNPIEFKSVEQAGTALTRAKQWLNGQINGQKVDPKLEEDMEKVLNSLKTGAYQNYKTQFGRVKQRYKLDEEPIAAPGSAASGGSIPSFKDWKAAQGKPQ